MPERTRVIGVGAAGHAKVLVDILRFRDEYDLVGLLDIDANKQGLRIAGVEVLGDETMLTDLYQQGIRAAFIGIGSVGPPTVRRALYRKLKEIGFDLVPALHPTAVISATARLGEGPIVMANAVINADAQIGNNVIVNTGAIVEHDCVIEDHVHIATGARLAGTVTVSEGCHVGIGASIKQGVIIHRDAIVGAGAVVVADVPAGATVVGVPARIK